MISFDRSVIQGFFRMFEFLGFSGCLDLGFWFFFGRLDLVFRWIGLVGLSWIVGF